MVEEIKKRQQRLERVKEPVLKIWELIGKHIIPRYEDLTFDKMPYQQTGKAIYDGTGISAARIQAVGMQGYTVNESMRWFRLGFPIPDVEDVPANKQYFEDCERSLYAAYRRSNFYPTITNLFMQGGTLGTTVLYQEHDVVEQRLVFRSLHPREFYIQENRYRNVDVLHRKFDLSAREAKKMFPEERLSDPIKNAIKENPDKKFRFIHAVGPNEDRMYGKLDSYNKRFTSVYIEEKGEEPLIQSGYDENPYMVWRWYLLDDGPYGGGPGWDALYDVMGLNKMSKSLLVAVDKMANPPMVALEELRGLTRFTPSGVTWTKDMSNKPEQVLQRIDISGALEREQNIREIVKQHFNVDFFLMLAHSDQQMTATEIRERQTEKSVMLGPAVGNLNVDVLQGTIDRTHNILGENGELPEPPESLEEFVGMDMKIDFLSPLSQAQKRITETQGLQVFVEKMVGLTEVAPGWADNINWDEYTRAVADGEGVQQRVLRSHEEVAEIRAEREEQEQAAQQAEMENLQSETAKNMSRPVEPESLLAKIEAGQA